MFYRSGKIVYILIFFLRSHLKDYFKEKFKRKLRKIDRNLKSVVFNISAKNVQQNVSYFDLCFGSFLTQFLVAILILKFVVILEQRLPNRRLVSGM